MQDIHPKIITAFHHVGPSYFLIKVGFVFLAQDIARPAHSHPTRMLI